MATINVKDAAGSTVALEKPLPPGVTTASASRPVTLASDDLAVAVLGAAGDAASTTTTIKAALRGIATALGITAFDLGSGTGGSRTLRMIPDSTAVITKGTAGSPSVDVITIQGAASMTPVTSGGVTITQAASSTITRPADTTAYASGDLVANSTTAGSVAALQFTTLARVSGGSGIITGARIQKSTASATNAAFRIHYFSVIPTFTSAGDNSAISTVVVASAKGYLGYVDIPAMTAFSDVAWGTGSVDNSRGGIPFVAVAQIIYAIVEARGAYTPGNAEVFTISTFALQD